MGAFLYNNIEKYIEEINETLRSLGLLLVSGNARPNVMATHWGQIGFLWGKPVFTAAVRKNRCTYGHIRETGVFTVNVPRKDLRNEIMKIEMVSGHNVDKFTEYHLHPVRAKNIDTYIVGDCGIHLECRVIFRSPVAGAFLDKDIKTGFYEGQNYVHTLFYGEILDIYET